MKKFAAFLLLALVIPAASWAQPRPARKAAPAPKPAVAKPAVAAPAEEAVYPIEGIRATGSKLYPEAAILAVAGLKTGEMFDKRKAEIARDNLVIHGAFLNVSYRYDPAPSQRGYLVTFEVVDFDQLFDYRFDRLDAGDEKALRAFLKEREPLFGDKIPGSDTVLARYRAMIGEYLKSKGQTGDVTGKVTLDDGKTFVLFSPPGRLPAVATVSFTGNKLISATMLQNTLHPVAVGSLYTEARFRELLDTSVRPLYDARGRLRMKFTKIETKPSDTVKGLAVAVTIEEGESYSFGELTVEGAPGAEAALRKAAGISSGDVADLTSLPKAQDNMHRVLRANGHMGVTSTMEKKISDADKICDLVVRLTPGPKYTFGRLILQGLDLHGEHEMRRIWTMKPGAVFNAEYPIKFINTVQEDKLFDDLRSLRHVNIPDERALTVDVKLIFNEPKPKILQ